MTLNLSSQCSWRAATPLLLSGLAAFAAADTLPPTIWAEQPSVRAVLTPTTDFSKAEKYEQMQGGAGSSKKSPDQNAYSHHTQTLDFEGLQRFKIGNGLFNKFWVSSPSSTLASDGLGPFFNARACQSCHIKDGRGQRPVADEKTASLVIQLKRNVSGDWQRDPIYGSQLHTSAVPGVTAEALVYIGTTPYALQASDQTNFTLNQPSYHLESLHYGKLHDDTVISPRIAPAMTGLGLLQSIKAEDILAYADPEDANNDGISGKPNWQTFTNGEKRLGRFGHKAAKSSLEEQTAGAFLTDMGLSTPLHPFAQGDCTTAQTVCENLATGVQAHLGTTEVSEQIADLVTFYSSHLAVPARRDFSDAAVLTGKSLFYTTGCASCHIPKHITAKDAEDTTLQFQLIWPYTDLLLHDMGDQLADGAGEGDANGREWRTAPLWGIGLAQSVNPRTSFLHDGRANTLLEAVLWHGGEAQPAKDKVLAMKKFERDALIKFLESL